MEASKLCSRVSDIVQDSSYTQAIILGILNEGQLEVASGGDGRSGIELLAPLPDLFKVGTVTLAEDATSVALPSDYHRGLVIVHKSNGDPLKRYDSYRKFLADYPGLADTGPVESYVMVGSTLYCQPAPSSDTILTVHYYRLPDDMEISDGPPAVDDEPDGIPSQLHSKILVHYACAHIYAEIEDGIEGAKANTAYHTAQYQLGLAMLKSYIGPEDADPENVDDSSDDYIY